MKKSTKTLAAAALAISALTPVAAAAASTVEPGVYTATNYYTLAEFKKLSTADKTAALSAPSTVVVVANQAYKATDVLTASNSQLPTLGQKADEYTTPEGNKLVSGKPINPDALKVESVSAITTTIDKAANQQLKVQINGTKEVTVKELTDAGYTVDFKYNKTSGEYNKTTGVVNATGLANGATFKYAVEVTDKDGKKVTSAWTDVTVKDTSAYTKVTKVALSNKLDYVTAEEVGLSVLATEALTAGGKTVSSTEVGVTLPAVKSITSSDETVLYSTGGAALTARKAGTATLTIEFVGIAEKVTLAVEVKAKQTAKGISEATTKTSLTATGKEVKFKTVDENGQQLRGTVNTSTNLTAVVKSATGATVATLTGTASAFATGQSAGSIETAGKYTVEVSAGTTKIGTYTLEVVDTASAKADSYKILTTDNKAEATLDIKGDNGSNTTTVKVSDYANGVALGSTLSLTDITKFKVATATPNSKVVTATGNADGTITLTAGTQTGTETVQLKTVEGEFEQVVATFTVNVKNTTPQVTSLAVKDVKDPIVLNQSWVKDATAQTSNIETIKTAIAGKVQSNLDAFTSGLIDKVEITSQGTVIVTVKSENGGKEFTLPFTLKDDVKPTITSAKIGEVTATITDNLSAGTGTIAFVLDANTKYTTGTVATSETVSAVITYEGKEIPVSNVTVDAILNVFKANVKGDDILGSTLNGKTVTVKLEDTATPKNSTTYTVTFTTAVQ